MKIDEATRLQIRFQLYTLASNPPLSMREQKSSVIGGNPSVEVYCRMCHGWRSAKLGESLTYQAALDFPHVEGCPYGTLLQDYMAASMDKLEID